MPEKLSYPAWTFEADVLGCPRCGGRMQVIALIEEPSVIKAILDHDRGGW